LLAWATNWFLGLRKHPHSISKTPLQALITSAKLGPSFNLLLLSKIFILTHLLVLSPFAPSVNRQPTAYRSSLDGMNEKALDQEFCHYRRLLRKNIRLPYKDLSVSIGLPNCLTICKERRLNGRAATLDEKTVELTPYFGRMKNEELSASLPSRELTPMFRQKPRPPSRSRL